MIVSNKLKAAHLATQEEIEALFSPFAAAITGFSQIHSLQIEKCQRGNSGWELTGQHPAGGTIHLLVLYDQIKGLGIAAVWQFPCPETGKLYSHFRPMQCFAMNPENVEEALSRELDAIHCVKFGYWTHMAPLAKSA